MSSPISSHSRTITLAFAFLAIFSSSTPLLAQQNLTSISDNDSSFSTNLTGPLRNGGTRGYFPYSNSLENRSNNPLSLNLQITNTFDYNQHGISSNLQISLPPNQSKTQSQFTGFYHIPKNNSKSRFRINANIHPPSNNGINAFFDSESSFTPFAISNQASNPQKNDSAWSIYAKPINDQFAKFLVENNPKPGINPKIHDKQQWHTISHYTSSTSSPEESSVFTTLSPEHLPENWQALSTIDAVILKESEWTNLRPSIRNSILQWMRLGGQLIILTETTNPSPTTLNLPNDSSFGSYHLLPFRTDANNAKELFNILHRPITQLQITGDMNSQLPNQFNFDSNMWLFIPAICLYILIIGPINLATFAKQPRRHLLFFSTPIIALTTSLILILFITFKDGFGGTGKRIVLMEVRPETNQHLAYIHQLQSSRTGVLLNNNFEIPNSTVLSPWLHIPNTQNSLDNALSQANSKLQQQNFSLDWQGEKILASGDWFRSRAFQHHILTSIIPTRGEISRIPGQQNQWTSQFDFPLDELLFHDHNGTWHIARNIAPGVNFSLTPLTNNDAAQWLALQNTMLTSREKSITQRLFEQKNRFFAISSHGPALDSHPKIKWETSTLLTLPLLPQP